MEAKEYLERVKKIDIIIKNKLNEYRRWVEVAEGLGGFSTSDRVQASRNLHQIPNAIGSYIDIESEINELKRERKAIIHTLEKLPPDEYEVIYKLYVEDLTPKEVAYQCKRSYDWVKVKKRNGLAMVQELI